MNTNLYSTNTNNNPNNQNNPNNTANGLSVELNVETEALMRVSSYARLEHMAPEVLLRSILSFGLRSYERMGISGIIGDVSQGGF